MRKLFLFTSSFPYGKGEQFLEDEIEFLAEAFKVKIIPFSYGGIFKSRKLPENVEVTSPLLKKNFSFPIFLKIFLSSSSEFKKIKFRFRRLRLFMSAWRSISYFLSNKSILREIESLSISDIVYFYWGHVSAFAIPFLPNVKAKLVMRLHRGDLYEYLHDNYFPFREQQLRKVHAIVPISFDGYNYLIKKYPFAKSKIYVHKLGVKNDSYITPKSTDGTIRVVSVSSISYVKRVHLICEILKYLNLPKIIWTHFGDGPLRKKLEEEVKKLPSKVIVDLKGHVDRKKIFQFYRENPVDFFINVSSNEGIPVSIMEAISFGIPVIATAVGGTPEILNEDIGILINKNFEPKKVANIIQDTFNSNFFSRKRIKEYWRAYYNAERNYRRFVGFLQSL